MRTISMSALLGLGLSLSLLPASALGQDQSSSAEGEIVVQGDRSARDEAARDYLAAVEFGRHDVQAARWSDRICPKVMGLEGQIADVILDRIKFVAAGAGIGVAPDNCSTNITIAFVNSGEDFMATLRQRAPRRLKQIPRGKQDFIFGADAPVRWWYGTEVMGSGGRKLVGYEPVFVQCEGGCSPGSALPANDNSTVLTHYNNSIIDSPTERYIRSAAVVIDMNRASGTAIDSLADYVSLVALAEVWPESGRELSDTILTLFDDREGDDGELATLSVMDQQFLCELYEMPLDRTARYQKGRILQGLRTSDQPCIDSN